MMETFTVAFNLMALGVNVSLNLILLHLYDLVEIQIVLWANFQGLTLSKQFVESLSTCKNLYVDSILFALVYVSIITQSVMK